MLEEVIERVSEMPFEAFLRRELFEPSGMEHTGFALPKWDRDNVAHTSLWTVPASALPGEARYENPLERPAAWRVMLSTPDDLFLWYRALRAGRVLTAESRRKLFTPVMENYAYGWNVVLTNRGTKLIHHGGGGSGVGTVVTFRWFVDEDTLVVITNNAFLPGFSADFVMGDVEALLFGGGGMMPPPAIERSETANVAGTYRLPNGATFNVVRAPNGPLVAVTRDADAVAALLLGGTAGGNLPQDNLAKEILVAAARGDLAPFERVVDGDVAENHTYLAGVLDAATKKLGALKDVATMHYRSFVRDGAPELQSFVRLRFERGDSYLRVMHLSNGKLLIDRLRPPDGVEAVLAPSAAGGYTTWEPRLGSAVHLSFGGDSVRLTGSAGSVTATRDAQP